MFWVLLTLSLACADKLDRTYLPPPGSQYAGGRPEDIQVPFEYSEANYPANPDDILNREIAIGIDRKGPKEIQESINFSDRTSQQSKDFVKAPVIFSNSEYFPRSSNISDNKPKYPSSERPDVDKFQRGQNGDEFIISNVPEKYLSNNRIYPQETPNRYFYTKPTANNNYVSNSPLSGENTANGGLNGLISLPCNKSLTNSFNNDPCIVNSNSKQYLSTLIPTSIVMSTTITPATKIPNFSERSSIKPQNNGDISSTTSNYPTIKDPLISFNVKRPERVQAKSDREAVILNYENVLTPEGYAYNFDTSNEIHGDESGITLNGVRAKGSYSYIGDDGKLYRVIYTADENGFRPEGDHLPTPPPIPDAILKVIEKAYEDKKAGIIDDGSYDENKYGHKKYQKDFNNLNPYMSTQKQMKLNEYLNSDNISHEPNQHNAYLKNPENKQSDDISNKQVSGPAYSTNLNNFKNSSIPAPDNYDEIDNEDAGEKDYRKLDNMKPTSKNVDNKYSQNTSLTNKAVKNSPIIDSRLYNQSGYPYYSSQNEKEFPTRFSEIHNDEDEEKFHKDAQISPKPFMTPYVSRNEDDELQNYDSKEKLYDEPRYHSKDKIHQDYNNENYPVDGSNTNEENDSTTSLVEDNKFKSTHNGYFYPKAINSDVILNKQFSDPNESRATYKPFEFSTRTSIIPDEGKYYSSTTEKDFRLTTTQTETSMEYQTSTIPSYSPKTYENAYEETNEPTYFNKGVSSTEKNIEISIPKFGPNYSPNINIMTSDTFNFPSSTEKVLGEDFSGPKRPQSFDPRTGYQY